MDAQQKIYPTVLTIAGSDSSGGAGIQADIKTISANGCYAASVITALTAQNTQGVQAIQSIPPQFIQSQLDSVFSDLQVHAVKIGMMHDKDTIEVASNAMRLIKPRSLVVDPVMVAKGGAALIKPEVVNFLIEKLLPLATLITPNVEEAEKVSGIRIRTEEDMQRSAKLIGNNLNTNVLIKGGHLNGNTSPDILYQHHDNTYHWFISERINTKNTHGTGCTLSSAIASFLAKNYSLYDSVSYAKNYLTQAILSGKDFAIGQGHGPVDHFFKVEKTDL